MLGFIIGNSKYLKGPRGLGGPSGLDPLHPGSDGQSTKIIFASLGIFVCTFTSSIPLGVCGLDFIPTTICVSVVINGVSIIVTID
jgi:hypothetical protein